MDKDLHAKAWVFVTLFVITVVVFGMVSPEHAWSYRLPDTGQDKCYDNTQEIPCPQPGEPFYGQDAQYMGPQPAYRDNGDGTVTDLNTGLIWQQGDDQNGSPYNSSDGNGISPPYYTWQEAADYCAGLSLASYQDWRLPAVKELTSLVNLGKINPAIDTGYFPVCRSYYYWSVSTYAYNSSLAWNVVFNNGNVTQLFKTNPMYVRCVRGVPE